MTDPHDFDASDGGRPLIYRRTPRIVAQACVGCRLSLNACQANRDINRAACCDRCAHESSASSDD